MKSGIYKILNIVNGKCYIGSAVYLGGRYDNHYRKLRLNEHENQHLQNAWNKYGKENFSFEILEYCDKSELLKREQHYIDLTKCYDRSIGYNKAPVAGNNLGIERSDEAKEKQRLGMTGFKHSEDTLVKMRKIQSQRSIETRTKLSKSKMGHEVSEETKAKIGAANSRKDKWPHADGYYCKCGECRNKRYLQKTKQNLKIITGFENVQA